jgi:hypothetical protein
MAKGACPKCDKALTHATLEPIPIKQGRVTWKGVKIACPFCSSVLSVAIDPMQLRNEITADVVRSLSELLQEALASCRA